MSERISEEVRRERRVRPPVHTGRVLQMEFLGPLDMTFYGLAKATGALRLGRYFGTGAEFWINLQSRYDLEVARDRAGDEIERQIRPLSPA